MLSSSSETKIIRRLSELMSSSSPAVASRSRAKYSPTCFVKRALNEMSAVKIVRPSMTCLTNMPK